MSSVTSFVLTSDTVPYAAAPVSRFRVCTCSSWVVVYLLRSEAAAVPGFFVRVLPPLAMQVSPWCVLVLSVHVGAYFVSVGCNGRFCCVANRLCHFHFRHGRCAIASLHLLSFHSSVIILVVLTVVDDEEEGRWSGVFRRPMRRYRYGVLCVVCSCSGSHRTDADEKVNASFLFQAVLLLLFFVLPSTAIVVCDQF